MRSSKHSSRSVMRTPCVCGHDEIKRGEGMAFASMDDFAAEIRAIGEEASRELAAETRG
jgi:hypothetical protein